MESELQIEEHPAQQPLHQSKSENQRTDADHDNIQNFAPVARIMRAALPEHAKISAEAKECMQECVSEFVSFIWSEACESSQQARRTITNGEDVLRAMMSLGFENYSEVLWTYLARYNDRVVRDEDKRRAAETSAIRAQKSNGV